MKYLYKGILLLVFAWLTFALNGQNVKAAQQEENVSVTVSSQISIVFEENGTNSVSDFTIANDSVVPIHVTNVVVTMYNGWELVNGDKLISADKKQLAFSFQGQYLTAGDNLLQLTIPEQDVRKPRLEVRRGAFSKSAPSQKAMELSIEYALGKKGFGLTFEGAEESIEQVTVYNGETVNLPTPERMKYNFLGWEDEEGNVYQDVFVMPMRNVVLTAKWQWTEAYAFYTDTDKTLRFVRSVEPLSVGELWDGKRITEVYTGVEGDLVRVGATPPWYEYQNLKRVEILDWVQPETASFWFANMPNIEYLDLRKLDMSRSTSMLGMFSATGINVTEKVTALGLEDWDVSNVQNYTAMFRQFAKNANVFEMGDISGWDTRSAVYMQQMFLGAFVQSTMILDCSNWNVDLVTIRSQFKDYAGGTIIEPKWKS